MIYNLIILGGSNDLTGELKDFTKKRIQKCYDIVSELKEDDITIHFSGGFNKKFNQSQYSHSELCYNYFKKININNYNFKKEFHINNNNTVEEAINFGKYFEKTESIIKIITNDWHNNRVCYLFNKVFEFYGIKNYEIISIKSDIIDNKIIKEEKIKLENLINKPYGLWKTWMINKN